MTDRTLPRATACALLCAGAVMLAGCNKATDSQTANPPSAATSPAPAASANTPQPSAYVPPTADQLYQLVAPIALFPDKLLAQVLAGSTYPDQVTAADGLLAQHPNLTGALLADAVNPQPWDPSIKGLTQFPSVLDQMAQNIQWTTSLGQAYANDPADVMNAIQVMRQRAQRNGSLRSSPQMRVVSEPTANVTDSTVVQSGENAPPVYSGPAVVPPPTQTIVIQPANPETVYVPQYDPETVYGPPVAAYPGYTYAYPDYTYVQPEGYSTGQMVTAGAIGFGVGVVVAALLDHHHHDHGPGWGWNSWGMRWGGPRGDGGWQRPAVVHNDTVYVSHSPTIINRYVTNNINNSRTINNVDSNNRTFNTITNHRDDPRDAPYFNRNVANERAPAAAPRPFPQAMAMPHFGTPVRGAEPARFQQLRAMAPPAAGQPAHEAPRPFARPEQPPRLAVHQAPYPAEHETPREDLRARPQPFPAVQHPHPEAAPARETPRFESYRQPERAEERPAPRQPERTQERFAPRPPERTEQRPTPRPPERTEQRPAAPPSMRPMVQPAPRQEARPEPPRAGEHAPPAQREKDHRPEPPKHDDHR